MTRTIETHVYKNCQAHCLRIEEALVLDGSVEVI